MDCVSNAALPGLTDLPIISILLSSLLMPSSINTMVLSFLARQSAWPLPSTVPHEPVLEKLASISDLLCGLRFSILAVNIEALT